MKKLKLNLANMQGAEVLSREQLKKIVGGDSGSGGPGGDCPSGYHWLTCTTPGGTESWCRKEETGSANSLCEGIYPAYSKDKVSGQWSPVIIIQA